MYSTCSIRTFSNFEVIGKKEFFKSCKVLNPDHSPTDELFWIGGASDESIRDDIYPQTRYILCHLLSELFLALGTDNMGNELSDLLTCQEGYKRLVGCAIIFLLKRKNFNVTSFLHQIEKIHSVDVVYMELRHTS